MGQRDNRERRTRVLEDEATRSLIEQAVAELQAKTAALDAMVGLADADWSLDQDVGDIVFVGTNGIQATAPAQILGTYNTLDGTWLWGWDHPSVEPPLQQDAHALREYGRKHGIQALVTQKLSCEESDCWEFAALACKFCDRQGAYRGPAGSTMVFITFGTVRLSKAE